MWELETTVVTGTNGVASSVTISMTMIASKTGSNKRTKVTLVTA